MRKTNIIQELKHKNEHLNQTITDLSLDRTRLISKIEKLETEFYQLKKDNDSLHYSLNNANEERLEIVRWAINPETAKNPFNKENATL